ncbi:MAG: matrixin family metalloprotease [Gemmatimonadota bacterium]
MKKLLLFAVLLLTACDSPTVPQRQRAQVYDFRLVAPELKVLRWPTETTVKLFVVQDEDPTRFQHLEAAVQHGIRVWNNAAAYGEVTLARTNTVAEANVVIEYSTSASPLDLASCPPAGGLAVTTFCLTEDDEHLEPYSLRDGTPTNVKFILTVFTSSGLDAASVRRLVTHEIGHVLGIAQHSPRPADLMAAGTPTRDDPGPADRATLQVLYHTVPDITP